MQNMKIDKEWIDFACHLADVAGGIIRPYFRRDYTVKLKQDLSPVTQADEEAESAMRAEIRRCFPGHGILGEEGGREGDGAEWTWVLDPIDGTKSFITGKPLFTTLIALCRGDAPVLSVIDQPIISERWLGVTGQQTTLNDKQIRASSCEILADARLSTTSPFLFREEDKPRFLALSKQCAVTTYGGDAYAYALLAAGQVDLIVESGLKPYDMMALVPVLQGAGASLVDWSGRPLTIISGGDVIAAATGTLATQARNILSLALS
ncbi:MAG: histidinol-phosphatase [Alphaproteobacteria bacterium]|nr:histidinol-phosphatase [Alphaproteobacteria bacterium]